MGGFITAVIEGFSAAAFFTRKNGKEQLFLYYSRPDEQGTKKRRLIMALTRKASGNPANPPKNTGGSMTKDEIVAIKDRAERRAAIAANMNLFEKGE